MMHSKILSLVDQRHFAYLLIIVATNSIDNDNNYHKVAIKLKRATYCNHIQESERSQLVTR